MWSKAKVKAESNKVELSAGVFTKNNQEAAGLQEIHPAKPGVNKKQISLQLSRPGFFVS